MGLKTVYLIVEQKYAKQVMKRNKVGEDEKEKNIVKIRKKQQKQLYQNKLVILKINMSKLCSVKTGKSPLICRN